MLGLAPVHGQGRMPGEIEAPGGGAGGGRHGERPADEVPSEARALAAELEVAGGQRLEIIEVDIGPHRAGKIDDQVRAVLDIEFEPVWKKVSQPAGTPAPQPESAPAAEEPAAEGPAKAAPDEGVVEADYEIVDDNK